MRVLITGTSGLSEELSKYLNRNNIIAECISVRDDDWKKSSFTDYGVIVHVAGIVPKKGVLSEDYYSVNRDLTLMLAEKAKLDGVKQFVFISSMSVYNTPISLTNKQGIITLKTKPDPQNDYGKSKFEAEQGLEKLKSDSFKVSIIRSPSIYSEELKSYLNQYELLVSKIGMIPDCFKDLYRSAIYTVNLFELIRLILITTYDGIICPDDGQLCAMDYCQLTAPSKHRSRLIGKIINVFFKNNQFIRRCFGQVTYDSNLSNVFDGEYRICTYSDIVKRFTERP